jgi:Flp pilus assembly protein TadD
MPAGFGGEHYSRKIRGEPMSDIPKAKVKQLAFKIKGTGQNPRPRFSFFLGAGASVQSQIPSAGEMIRDFRNRIIQEQCPAQFESDSERNSWIEGSDWYKDAQAKGELYSRLFEQVEQKERGRQRYIEQMIEGKKPSYGYLVLANLMAQNYVNTVITTNFDDLVYSACTTYTDIRPLVYAYGVMVSDLRVTNSRPKILKLHGDYLYSALKNLLSETAQQDQNLASHVPLLLNEYGLVVIGYAGGDKSVVDLLKKIPKANDLYWCVRSGDELNSAVKDLLLDREGFIVEIEDFDHLMDDISEVVGFSVPVMLRSFQKGQDRMIDQFKSLPQTWKRQANILRQIADSLDAQAAQQHLQGKKNRALYHFANGLEAQFERRFLDAESEFAKAIELDPSDTRAYVQLALVYTVQSKFPDAERQLALARGCASESALADINYLQGYLYMVRGRYDDAVSSMLAVLKEQPQNPRAHNVLGVAYLNRGAPEQAAVELKRALDLDSTSYYPWLNLGVASALLNRNEESHAYWKSSLAAWQQQDPVDAYNHALLLISLGDSEKGLSEIQRIVTDSQVDTGIARLALQTAQQIASAPSPPDGMANVVQMLRRAIDTAKVDKPQVPQSPPRNG